MAFWKSKKVQSDPIIVADPNRITPESIKENLVKLSQQAKELRRCVEAVAILQLIVPFLKTFGWDPTDPSQGTAEKYTSHRNRADIMLLSNGVPQIVIEAKRPGTNLAKHIKQLAGYFNDCHASIGILSDGIKYWFFSYADSAKDKGSYMDETPFACISLDKVNIEKNDEFLLDLCRDNFDVQNLVCYSNSDHIRAKIYGLIGTASGVAVDRTIHDLYLIINPGLTPDRINKMIRYTRYHSRYKFRHGNK